MQYFPLFLSLRCRRILIVGGGDVAQRKAELLIRAGAKPLVVAPSVLPSLEAVVRQAGGDISRKSYDAKDLRGCAIAVSATNNVAVNRQVSADAQRLGVPINVVDSPALCDFIFPAMIDRPPLTVAVSSAGASPVLARRLRAHLEEWLPPGIGRLADFCGRWRTVVQKKLIAARRRAFWESFIDSAAAEAVLRGDEINGEILFNQSLQDFADNKKSVGGVYLIGAGPGAADLLTFRAHRLLQKADVVIYDRLVSAEVLELARRDAEKIFVGKARGRQTLSQEDINHLLINRARQGLCVARLKGGDPFIFGRGGEELLAVRAAGLPLEIVPGITAANGCAAAAGIPLTHRHLAAGVRMITVGRRHLHDAAYWRRLAADEECTLVFYMAAAELGTVAANLIHSGREAATAAAVICAGTTAAQRVITDTLQNIAANAAAFLLSPALLIVGDVVRLREDSEVSWSAAAPPFSSMAKENYAICGTSASG